MGVTDAPVAKSKSALGIESNRLIVISDGSLIVAFFCISVAPLCEGGSVCRVESNRLAVSGDGLKIVSSAGTGIDLADQGIVACSGFSLFALLFSPESCGSLLGFFPLNFYLGCHCRLVFPPCLSSCQPLLLYFLSLARSFRLGDRSCLAFLLSHALSLLGAIDLLNS